MKRSPSRMAQVSFDLSRTLQHVSTRSRFPMRLFARMANRLVTPIANQTGKNRIIVASVYGREMIMPAEQFLPSILAEFPQYNRPLAMAVDAIAACNSAARPLTVIDVGANIGDTVAVIEDRLPNVCNYLCIEPDPDLAEICAANHKADLRIHTRQAFIGEDEGTFVRLEDDGRANPSTKLQNEPGPDDGGFEHRLLRLDTVVLPFAESNGAIHLLKVDTEGYDFSILRSGSEVLKKYKPGIFLEWYPKLLKEAGEDPCGAFQYLIDLGYVHFVFFTNQGDLYCSLSNPSLDFLRSLMVVCSKSNARPYFDAFVSTDDAVCQKLVELCA